MKKRDLLIAPICEAALVLVAGLAGFALHKPLLFSSLGPTAYELIEQPERPSARPFNVFAGHLIGVLSGFAALFVTHAFKVPEVASGTVAIPRIGAAVTAAALTVLFTLLLKASQPAAVSTSLLIALGVLQQWQDGFVIMGAVALMLACGEPLRAWRMRDRARASELSTTT
jgi:hypothetical protein